MWIDDEIMKRHEEKSAISVWIPQKNIVVLGSSNKAKAELHQEEIEKRQIEVLTRYGGGGTVVLYKGCVVVSCSAWVANPYKNDVYFEKINQALIDCLGERWPALKKMEQFGISDVGYKNKKTVGTSMFRSRNYLLYQASILVDLDLALIEEILRHPSKEPGYRAKRSHSDFLIGLSDLEKLSVSQVSDHLANNFQSAVDDSIGTELVEPIESQFKNLIKRIQRI
jgi:lipoate---protein ligase